MVIYHPVLWRLISSEWSNYDPPSLILCWAGWYLTIPNKFIYSTDHQNPYMVEYGVFYDVGNGSTYNMTSYPIPLSFKTLQFIEEYLTPCICAVGIFFNVFAGLILRKTEFKKVTPFVYLLALCIIDSVYLTAKLIPNRLYNVYIVPGVCQIVYYLSFLSIFMEWWIIVMCLSERCLSLYSSRKSSKYCNAFRVKCAIIFTVSFPSTQLNRKYYKHNQD
jgi:hypothetical protein